MAEYGIARSKRTCIEIKDCGIRGVRVAVNGVEIDAWVENYKVDFQKSNPGIAAISCVELRLRCSEIKLVEQIGKLATEQT